MTTHGRRSIAGATLVIGLSACAGTPTAPTATGTEVVAPAVGASQATTATAESPFPGYYPRKTRNGQTLYCREDSVAGTRIPKLVCATEDTLRSQSAESKQQINDMRQTAGAGGCNPAEGC